MRNKFQACAPGLGRGAAGADHQCRVGDMPSLPIGGAIALKVEKSAAAGARKT